MVSPTLAVRLVRVCRFTPFRIEALDCVGEHVQVGESAVAAPGSGPVIADHDVIAVLGFHVAALAEFEADAVDVLGLTGDEHPSWAGVIRLCVLLQHFRPICDGIDSDRHKEDVASDTVAEQILDLREASRDERTNV